MDADAQARATAKVLPPPRLTLLQASLAPVAVIFRRGPSDEVEVIRWDTDTDTFLRGHWFRGRIYDKRSDLSPDGELLAYFAAKRNAQANPETTQTHAWTAVSRPPWLTALARWPMDNTYGGGAQFEAKRKLMLNYVPEEVKPDPAPPPTALTVSITPNARNEDTIYDRRLARDGWTLRRDWQLQLRADGSGYDTVRALELVKQYRTSSSPVCVLLERRVERTSYRERFSIVGAKATPPLPPGPIEWMDWDFRGRIIALSNGRVWAAMVDAADVAPFTELLDLRDDRFEERHAPARAQRW